MASGPPIDRGWAWMILLGSHIVLAFLIGGYKSLGIIFVEFKELFGASSAMTALLMGLIPGGMSVLSPFATAIGERTSFRIVAVIGGLICGLGTFLTAFAPDMTFVIMVFGLLTGVGYGFAFSPSIVVVGQYFHKRRALANGLAFAGGSLGQLLIPLMLRVLTDEMGFRNAMMIYGALVLNIVVGASLFRPISSYADKEVPKVDVISDASATVDKLDDVCDKCGRLKQHNDFGSSNEKPENKLIKSLKDEERAISPAAKHDIAAVPSSHTEVTEIYFVNGSSDAENGQLISSDLLTCHCEGDMYSKYQYTSTGSLCYMQDPPQVTPSVNEISNLHKRQGTFCEATAVSFCCCCVEKTNIKPLLQWDLFKDPLYILWVLGICMGNCGYVNSVLFLPPYLAEIGVSKYTAAVILSAAGVCDLVGRISGGWFGDLGYVQRHNFMAFCMMLTAGACVVFAVIGSLSTAIMYAVFVGVLGGSYIALMAVVLVDFIGLEQLPNGFGIGVFFMGAFNLPTPALLGLLKDHTGSYTAVYVINGILMAFCGIFFIIANFVLRARKKKKMGD